MPFWKKPYRPLNQVLLNFAALHSNLKLYRSLLPGVVVAPVLKSNAYGHGLREVAGALKNEGCPFYIVDSIYEAYEIRRVDRKTPVLILGYNHESNLRKKSGFHFAATSLEQFKALVKMKVPLHVELNTGMNRMGFAWRDIESWLPELAPHAQHIVGLFTHLADADNPEDNSFTELQAKRFEEMLERVRAAGIQPQWIHVGNSAGSLKLKKYPFNMVRLGFSLYGNNVYDKKDPTFKELTGLKPVLEFQATLVQIQNLRPGDGVSYGLQFKAEKPTRIGVLSAGYYEGLPIALSNQGVVQVHGHPCPIRGRVCMNHTLIELGDISAQLGDPVTIYSADPHSPAHVNEQAKKAKTIPYELLVRLSESVRRQAR